MNEAERSRPKVVVLDHAFDTVDGERDAAARSGAHFEEFQCAHEDDARRAARGADVVLVNFAPMTRRVLTGLAPGARVVRYGVGVDNVDVDAARELGVRVANVPDYGVRTVADHTVALLLTLLRRIPWYDGAVREHDWVPAVRAGPLRGFASTTVGLVGAGNIGLAVADRLRPSDSTSWPTTPTPTLLGPLGTA
nr:NAD(P)-dependent oxidoreductase [Nocardiopsis salina]